MIKQTDAYFIENGYDAIVSDGCFFRDLLYASEFFTGRILTAKEIGMAYHYAIPDFMEDHRRPNQDRCFIKEHGHIQIARIGFYILQERKVKIIYKYRWDKNEGMIIGRSGDLYSCNFFISKCKMPKFNHFYVSSMAGAEEWNPGVSFSDELLSIRGFQIEIQRSI